MFLSRGPEPLMDGNYPLSLELTVVSVRFQSKLSFAASFTFCQTTTNSRRRRVACCRIVASALHSRSCDPLYGRECNYLKIQAFSTPILFCGCRRCWRGGEARQLMLAAPMRRLSSDLELIVRDRRRRAVSSCPGCQRSRSPASYRQNTKSLATSSMWWLVSLGHHCSLES